MYRWHKDRNRMLRLRKRYHKVRRYWGASIRRDEVGRFRKSGGLGCTLAHCGLCQTTEKTRQELRADIDEAEYREEVSMQCLGN